jgi:mRNA-degrading endonuclease RelE of RelBE toxin-antitoxin system
MEGMQRNPFQGDIARLSNQPSAWRRRIAAYRIFFDVDAKQGLVDIVDIIRRTSTTY